MFGKGPIDGPAARVRLGELAALEAGRTLELQEPGVGYSKSAGVDVEAMKLGLEVDVQPCAAGCPRFPDRDSDELGADAGSAKRHVDERVENKGVDTTVPADVHETNQPVHLVSADPT